MTARLATLDSAGKLNGSTVEQELLGKRRLARIRMRNNREGAAFVDLCLDIRHGI